MTELSIETIAEAFDGLSPASGRCWQAHPLVSERLFLSRGEHGEHALFLTGDRASFGTLPPVPGVDHASDIVALPEGSPLAALRLMSRDPVNGPRVMGHIAYELASRLLTAPTTSNEALLAASGWVLVLLGDIDREPLSRERQIGLVGECIFLRMVLRRALEIGIPPSDAVARWTGHGRALRDFVARGLAVEVKTTTATTRRHEIGSLEQLDPQGPNEDVFVFSVGLRRDISAPRKLSHYVEDARQLLVTPDGKPDLAAQSAFTLRLELYGYQDQDRERYDQEPGYLPRAQLPGAFFTEADLERLRLQSFVGGALPAMVTDIRYTLEITAEPLDAVSAQAVLDRLLTAPPVAQPPTL
jgi:hypothetical protein